jgi:hypothetical protein
VTIISPSTIAVKAGSEAAADAIGANFSVQSWPLRVKTRTLPLSMTIWVRQPSYLIS